MVQGRDHGEAELAGSGVLRQRSIVIQQKTGRPVPFEITEPARDAVAAWLTYPPSTVSFYKFIKSPQRISLLLQRSCDPLSLLSEFERGCTCFAQCHAPAIA
ncbi:hypothetical protein [Brevundimonas naejangsanensis]|uniref:hypothetical protein n=1 Tax=Brevundimonas naejangsanensis TaxID=588932 RepID=UPI0026ED51C2|nr:hypothetical protein [Brevundimonas naejangsanensis]